MVRIIPRTTAIMQNKMVCTLPVNAIGMKEWVEMLY